MYNFEFSKKKMKFTNIQHTINNVRKTSSEGPQRTSLVGWLPNQDVPRMSDRRHLGDIWMDTSSELPGDQYLLAEADTWT